MSWTFLGWKFDIGSIQIFYKWLRSFLAFFVKKSVHQTFAKVPSDILIHSNLGGQKTYQFALKP